MSLFCRTPLDPAVPPFTPADQGDMAKKMIAAKTRKILAERLEKSGAGSKRKSAPSVGSDGSPRPVKRPSGQRTGVVITEPRLAERTPPRPAERAPPSPHAVPVAPSAAPSEPSEAAGTSEPARDAHDRTFLRWNSRAGCRVSPSLFLP